LLQQICEQTKTDDTRELVRMLNVRYKPDDDNKLNLTSINSKQIGDILKQFKRRLDAIITLYVAKATYADQFGYPTWTHGIEHDNYVRKVMLVRDRIYKCYDNFNNALKIDLQISKQNTKKK